MRPRDPRLEALLSDGTAAFRAAFDLVPDAIGVLWAIRDGDGRVVDFETGYANPAMDRMIGVGMEQSAGRRLLEETPGFASDDVYALMRGVVESGRPVAVEVAVDADRGPIGQVHGVYVHRSIPFGPDGVLNLVTDITEQRRLETELERYAAAAAHDLREPILAVGFFTQLLGRRLENGRDAENERLVELLGTTQARATALIDGILEYARSDAGGEPEDVDVAALVAEVADSLAAAIDAAGADVHAETLPVVRARREQLGRVFQNLIANSLKFRAEAPPRVAVSAERADGGWRFAVRDNGVGIPAERAGEVFGMFARAHGGGYEGCGIGLAVCRKVVEGHGGRIWAEPADGGGTVVRFTLPAG
jgi:signal transduction histidine kinase